ncbi:hypothetical protein Taro_020670 [Colocasia esculenta]|uniref:Uncharacterized protein n=1 Tax=Colocasia esculenta TaxID=4460 RepID=A0A843UWX7_COLES|nr:hypothetical protein [Colocasia esculenta]
MSRFKEIRRQTYVLNGVFIPPLGVYITCPCIRYFKTHEDLCTKYRVLYDDLRCLVCTWTSQDTDGAKRGPAHVRGRTRLHRRDRKAENLRLVNLEAFHEASRSFIDLSGDFRSYLDLPELSAIS